LRTPKEDSKRRLTERGGLVPAEFVIEETFHGGDGRAYVLARAVDQTVAFAVSFDAGLGGCAVEQWLEMPRALDASGHQRRDLYGFCLKRASDFPRLKIGDRVVLE
jgi:hypothetical protein